MDKEIQSAVPGMTGFLSGLSASKMENKTGDNFGFQDALKEIQEELNPTDSELSFALFMQMMNFGSNKPLKERLTETILALREGINTLREMPKEEIENILEKVKSDIK